MVKLKKEKALYNKKPIFLIFFLINTRFQTTTEKFRKSGNQISWKLPNQLNDHMHVAVVVVVVVVEVVEVVVVVLVVVVVCVCGGVCYIFFQ